VFLVWFFSEEKNRSRVSFLRRWLEKRSRPTRGARQAGNAKSLFGNQKKTEDHTNRLSTKKKSG